MNGVLLINKPSGMTSHDVVQRVRRILKEKRVGHTGTLDPSATGLLVLCVGSATRFARFFEAGDKEYEAVMRLGTTTDTQDAEGRVLEERQYRPPDRERIVEVLRAFTGPIMQQPPVFSAIKIGGIPSYKLARTGRAAQLKPREVVIHSIDLAAYEDPFVRFTVRCSKGTYIRALCADIGAELGTGAHMVSLQRTRSGRFSLEQAVTLDELEARVLSGAAESVLVAADAALDFLPSRKLSDEESRRVLQGRTIEAHDSGAEGTFVRLYGPAQRFLGLGLRMSGCLKPDIILPERSPR